MSHFPGACLQPPGGSLQAGPSRTSSSFPRSPTPLPESLPDPSDGGRPSCYSKCRVDSLCLFVRVVAVLPTVVRERLGGGPWPRWGKASGKSGFGETTVGQNLLWVFELEMLM